MNFKISDNLRCLWPKKNLLEHKTESCSKELLFDLCDQGITRGNSCTALPHYFSKDCLIFGPRGHASNYRSMLALWFQIFPVLRCALTLTQAIILSIWFGSVLAPCRVPSSGCCINSDFKALPQFHVWKHLLLIPGQLLLWIWRLHSWHMLHSNISKMVPIILNMACFSYFGALEQSLNVGNGK